jgi:hypothetical protein
MFFLNIREINEKIGIGNRFAPPQSSFLREIQVTLGWIPLPMVLESKETCNG